MSGSPVQRWKEYYRPPWPFLLQLILVGVVFAAFITIFYPSVGALYDIRLMLVTLMFSDTPDDVPFSAIDDLQGVIDDYLDAIENLSANSLLDFSFTDPEHPVNSTVVWRNGSTTVAPIIDIDLGYLDHITEFDIESDFMVASTDSDLIGCTRWESCLTVGLRKGSYLFSVSSSLKRSNCPEDLMIEANPAVRGSGMEVIEEIKRLTTGGKYVVKRRDRMPRTKMEGRLYRRVSVDSRINQLSFDRTQLTMYRPMGRFGMIVVSLSSVHFVLMVMTLGRSFMYHRELMGTDPLYHELSPYEQFHSVIGFWAPISLATSASLIVAGLSMISDLNGITQFPSQTACVTFGLAGLLTIVTSVRYLKRVPHCYAVVLIIRQALGRFLMLMFILAPFIAALVFVGIFMFGFVSFHSENTASILRVILSIMFGDNILPTYAEFSDDSPIYNLLSFIYVTILTALAMWMFFTLFTAETVAIFQSQITPFLRY
jgi:hypothetical protein